MYTMQSLNAILNEILLQILLQILFKILQVSMNKEVGSGYSLVWGLGFAACIKTTIGQ